MISLKMVKGAEMAEGVLTEMQLPDVPPRFVIGRDPGAHWPIADRTLALSARHCEITTTPAGVMLRDLSTNGTFVNGAAARLAGEHTLHDGDRIELGPYTIVVQGGLPRAAVPPAAAAPAPSPAPLPAPLPAPAAARPASVEATAPLRGGDPAAMLASVAPAREGLTEILRAAPPAQDESVEVTKIRLAPKSAAAPAARPAGSTPMPAVGSAPQVQAAAAGPAPAPSAVVVAPAALPMAPAAVLPAVLPALLPAVARPAAGGEATALLAQLAGGLGLPADALADRDPAQAAAQVGALARAAVTVLRQLLEEQARERRQIGSRAPALLAVRDVNPLRLAHTPEAALLALLAPGADAAAPLQRAAAELASHQRQLLAAFRGAAQKLGEEIAPDALQAALPAAGAADTAAQQQARQAHLWALYSHVWQGMGLAPGQPWSQGFLEAALLHLATAYDASGTT